MRCVMKVLIGIIFFPLFLVLGVIFGTISMYDAYRRGWDEAMNDNYK